MVSTLESEASTREERGGGNGLNILVPADAVIIVVFEVFEANAEEDVVIYPFVHRADAMVP